LERKFREVSQNRVGTTYEFSTIAVEYGVVDLHIGTTNINGSALEVVHVARRELERNFEIFLGE
jgi:hypothetical protein